MTASVEGEETPWPSRRRKVRGQAARKREALIRVAARMFREQGFDRTTLSDLADALSITKPTVYYYFKSKEQLLVEILRRGQEAALEKLEQADRLDATGIEKLRAALLGYAEVATSEFGRCLIHVMQRHGAPLDAATLGELNERIHRAERMISRMIETGIGDGSIRPTHVKLLYLMIFGGLNGLAGWFNAGGRLSEREAAGIQLEILLNGIAGPAAPKSALGSPLVGRRR